MKLLLLLLLFFILIPYKIISQTSGDITKKNDEQTLIRLSGIKSKSIWEYYYVPGNDNAFRDSGFKSFSFFYENTGRILEYTKYHVYAALNVKEIYSYNKPGKITRNKRYNSNYDVIEDIQYRYSKKGNLSKEIHSAYYNSVRVGVYFTITANVNEMELFLKLQDELQIEPKLESYMITVNITDPEELNQYVVIGDEGEPAAMRFSWSQLSQESQKGLLSYEGPNRKENTFTSKFISDISYKYDKHGNLKEKTVYNTANDMIGKESYSYNGDNKKINYYKYNDNGRISSMEGYTYDNNGRLSQSIGMDPSGQVVSKLLYRYYDNGNLEEKQWLSSAGGINGKFIYTYDENNRLKEEIKFRGENEKESRLVYNYDENGNILEAIRYDVNNNKEKLWKYVYEVYIQK